jgi:acyl-CoA synthetase (AMP-forming)/AMP-acid ligase II
MAASSIASSASPGSAGSVPDLWRPFERTSAREDLLRTWSGNGWDAWSWDRWRSAAFEFAGGLRRLGVAPGDRVAFLLDNSSDACAGVLGAWLAGACILSLPLIARGMHPTRYLAQLNAILAASQPVVVVADGPIADALEGAGLAARVEAFQRIRSEWRGEPDLPPPDQAAFVQYSSGSTTEPKGCVLTPTAIARQLMALDGALEIDPERDAGVVWLPLSHDMGLFGCLLLTYWTGHPVTLGTPQRFLTQPYTWFEDCARFGATVSAAPGFALDLAVRAGANRHAASFPMRRLVVGGDRIEPQTLRRASRAAGASLPLESLLPAYGLAEAVLAVTMTPLGRGPGFLEVDADALEAGQVEPLRVDRSPDRARRGTWLTSAGRPLPGVDVTVEGATGVGEIQVQSPSLAAGYLDAPELTAERFTPRGLQTRDLGFLHDGELYVSGRVDDLISVGGRNVYARDIEAAFADIRQIRRGAAAVVEVRVQGEPRLVALVEPRDPDGDLKRIARGLAAASREATGVALDECLFLARGSLPKTPSGKVQRFRCRELATDAPPGTVRRVSVRGRPRAEVVL